MEGLVGFEPTIRELQSHALPLGYRPKSFINHVISFYTIVVPLSIPDFYFRLFLLIYNMKKERDCSFYFHIIYDTSLYIFIFIRIFC